MTEHLKSLTLDLGTTKIRSKEAAHEQSVAIADILHENSFTPHCMKGGPYDLQLSVKDGRLVFDIGSETGETAQAVLTITPLRGLIRDYFMICESYYDALKSAGCGKIEAIDMGRRGLHNEGAEALKSLLEARITIDHATARRLFTLVCVLHLK
mgnify:CR=1 FL=1